MQDLVSEYSGFIHSMSHSTRIAAHGPRLCHGTGAHPHVTAVVSLSAGSEGECGGPWRQEPRRAVVRTRGSPARVPDSPSGEVRYHFDGAAPPATRLCL